MESAVFWDITPYGPPKRRLTFKELHGFICRKIVLFVFSCLITLICLRLVTFGIISGQRCRTCSSIPCNAYVGEIYEALGNSST